MELITSILSTISFSWMTIPDIFVIYIIIYYLLLWTQAAKSLNLIWGFLIIFGAYIISYLFNLQTINWLFENFTQYIFLLVIIIFQPELRRLLERIGRGHVLSTLFNPNIQGPVIIKHLLRAVDQLSKQKMGALIVIEKNNNLNEYIDSGIHIDGDITSDLVVNLFWPLTPTHDGAIIVRENKIVAASCLLPLTDIRVSDRRLGTRHRAAIGLTEVTDAMVIVISEETGVISLAENGNLTRFLTKEALETRLFSIYSKEQETDYITLKDIKELFFKAAKND